MVFMADRDFLEGVCFGEDTLVGRRDRFKEGFELTNGIYFSEGEIPRKVVEPFVACVAASYCKSLQP